MANYATPVTCGILGGLHVQNMLHLYLLHMYFYTPALHMQFCGAKPKPMLLAALAQRCGFYGSKPRPRPLAVLVVASLYLNLDPDLLSMQPDQLLTPWQCMPLQMSAILTRPLQMSLPGQDKFTTNKMKRSPRSYSKLFVTPFSPPKTVQ